MWSRIMIIKNDHVSGGVVKFKKKPCGALCVWTLDKLTVIIMICVDHVLN